MKRLGSGLGEEGAAALRRPPPRPSHRDLSFPWGGCVRCPRGKERRQSQMNGRGRFNGATLSVLYTVMSQTKKNASKKKKKFNHTALYTDILSNRHSHLHVNNAPGSTAPPVTLGDPQTRPRLRPPIAAALVWPPSSPALPPAACSRRPRCGASVRRTRHIMLWLLILSLFFS